MKKTLVKSQVTRQELTRSHTITFQEISGGKILPRAFDTPNEHLDFHLKNLQKMPDVIRGVKVIVKKG